MTDGGKQRPVESRKRKLQALRTIKQREEVEILNKGYDKDGIPWFKSKRFS